MMRTGQHQGEATVVVLHARVRAFGPVQGHLFTAERKLRRHADLQRRQRLGIHVEFAELLLQPVRVMTQERRHLRHVRTVRIRQPRALRCHRQAQAARTRVGRLQHAYRASRRRRQFQPVALL
jgi:hypothetical protein